ncbi:MAG: hypothetical protein E6G12_08205 [Actinobacteria bacterium]|nr:MAG: hypothetical protein E6G12_08205 [Actinomycetota bacterium]
MLPREPEERGDEWSGSGRARRDSLRLDVQVALLIRIASTPDERLLEDEPDPDLSRLAVRDRRPNRRGQKGRSSDGG